MNKNLLKLLALPLVVGLMTGCSDDDDTTTPAPEPTVCVYHLDKAVYQVGDEGAVSAYAMLGETKVEDVVVDPTSIDTSKGGVSFSIKATSETCADDGATLTATVAAEETGDVTPENILPSF